MDIEEQQQVLQDFLVELAASFGLSATATSQVDENQLTVDLHGDGLGCSSVARWPPRCDPGDRPQHPAAAAAGRSTPRSWWMSRASASVVVSRCRRSSPTRPAGRRRGREIVFEVMSSVDRKQVHDVAGQVDGVSTSSEGEGSPAARGLAQGLTHRGRGGHR